MNSFSDMELLDAYAGQRSEEAFRELVARHIDLIYSAALRQLRDPQLAQEATQSAFIALAGKAGRLQQRTVIAGWLHRAAHFAGLNLQRAEARRKHWEEEAATVNASHEQGQDSPDELLPCVDGALAELGDADRDAIVLRFLRQQSLREVAHALGTSEETAKKRVSRALEKLRGLLARRGVAVPVAALAVGLSQLPIVAAPASWPAAWAVLAVNATLPAAASAGFLSVLTSLKVKCALTASVLVLAGLAVFLWRARWAPSAAVTPLAAPTPAPSLSAIKIKFTGLLVDDADKALKFYTQVLGFQKKRDLTGERAGLVTLVSPEEPDGPELILEPIAFPPAKTFQQELRKAGIPLTSLQAGNVRREFARLNRLGVLFTMKPRTVGPVTMAVFEDTCGNLIEMDGPAGRSQAVGPAGLTIGLTSVMVDDQDRALDFYTGVLGFVKKRDMPAGGGRWLTVVSPADPDGIELLLEPIGYALASTYQEALRNEGRPYTGFQVGDVRKEYERLIRLGVVFTIHPTVTGSTTSAVFKDTCGNLIRIFDKM